ncbi:MAG TPA: hybrid sensor histidine kinase/response regulator [Pseudomonas xinjiangensis]|uniref:histidine kinase n=2 Tax=root TaxID=1 RepID=A0A7V1BQL1_9GAMM|nr:hybrid sensor histidine kinase/response regulator [Halopseudomonas xinjiangensis]HEC47214.1 hybrid sensor histidine kinase/response regulator [Halopseudomonas xinjiangensis]
MQVSNSSSQTLPVDEPTVIAQQGKLASLRFNPQLEPGFLDYLHGKMSSRAGVVACSTVCFMPLFMWVDLAFLPEAIHQHTVPIRVMVMVMVISILWYACRPGRIAPGRAFVAMNVGYVCSGLMVIMVIGASRLVTTPVPVSHDGLYLVLLAGFFLLGLPMRHAVVGSWIIVFCYLITEFLLGASRYQLISAQLFLGSFAAIGSLGAYIYEYMMRSAYLNECLLEAARARAESESQSKTRFLATASHDLRQPLHAMSLFIQHLDERVTEPESRLTVKRLGDSTHLLQAMLNSLLDISRLSVGMVTPQLRTFNLQPWLRRLIGTLVASARERDIRMQLVCPKHSAVHADPVLLERLVRNYLNNALIHANATDVRVEVSREGSFARIAIVDNGCGLDEADQGRIFEEFTQLHNPARTLDKGVGLGLSICRQLLRLLDYPSGIHSAPGQGARFWFEVPAGVWKEEPRELREPAVKVINGLVGLVENDRINREATETLLRQWGCEVVSYETAEQALHGLEQQPVDLLLSDFRLEGQMDGLDLIHKLRAEGLYGGPAALVTADTSESLLEAARLADVGVIYKPVLPARLRRMVQKLMVAATES